jgi:hypothetical protein
MFVDTIRSRTPLVKKRCWVRVVDCSTLSAVNCLKDRVLLVLLGLLGLTLTAFFLGVLPYPFGILILLVLIVSRVLYKQ